MAAVIAEILVGVSVVTVAGVKRAGRVESWR